MNIYCDFKDKYIEDYITQNFSIDKEKKIEESNLYITDYLHDIPNNSLSNKLFISSNSYEDMNNLSIFDSYDYYIGFGNEIYAYQKIARDLEPSATINGYIYNKEFENKFEDNEFDLFIVFKNFSNCQRDFSLIINLLEIISIIKLVNQNYKSKIGININLNYCINNFDKIIASRVFDEKYEKTFNTDLIKEELKKIIQVPENFPLKYINNSNCVFFSSPLDVKMTADINIYKKSFTTTSLYGASLNNKNKRIEKEKYGLFDESNLSKKIKIIDSIDFSEIEKINSILHFNNGRIYKCLKNTEDHDMFLINNVVKQMIKNILNNDNKKLIYCDAGPELIEKIRKIIT